MPVYNDAGLLDKSIASFLAQTLDDIELICINDGSNDDSLEILNEYSKKYDSIKVLTQSNQGSGKARNYGIREAEGEYIGFLDADDFFIDKDALEKLYDVAGKNDALFVAGNIKLVDDKGNFSPFIHLDYYTDYGVILPEEYGIPWSFYKNIYKTSFIRENKIEFPDLLRGQDPVFLAEILAKIDKIYTVPTDVYAYFYISGANQCNTLKKRRDHMMHYRMVFDYLSDSRFDEIRHLFRYEMIGFISMMGVDGGSDILDATREIFADEPQILHDFEEAFYLKHMEDDLKGLIEHDGPTISLIGPDETFKNQTFTNYEITSKDLLNGDYVYLSNGDEKLDDDFLQASLKNILYNEADILIFNTNNLLNQKLKGKRTYKFTFTSDFIKEYIFDLCAAPKIYRREFLEKNNLGLDDDLKAILKAERIAYQRKSYGTLDHKVDLDKMENTLKEFNCPDESEEEFGEFEQRYLAKNIVTQDDLTYAQERLRETDCDLILSSRNVDEFKLKYRLHNLENDLEKLTGVNKKLKRKNRKLKKLNNELLDSSSWKMTKPLRKLRNLK